MRVLIIFIVSLVLAAVVVQFMGDRWEEPVRRALYTLKGGNIPSYSEESTDTSGVPFVHYKELNGYTAGTQYNSTIVCNYALKYHDAYVEDSDNDSHRKFFNCAAWLKNNITHDGDRSFFLFRWRQPWYDSVGTPFTSGMTSGLAVRVFTYAYQLSRDSSYLELCRRLIRGYFIPIGEGGFTYQTDKGWWYEELADTAMNSPLILDGHVFAITGLKPYLELSRSDSAAFLVRQGLLALKHRLPDYDAGAGAVYYDKYQKIADKHYHRLLAGQMKELYDISGDKFFLGYHEKWTAPLRRPYLLRIIEQQNVSGILLYLVVGAGIFIFLYILANYLRRRKRS